MMNARKSQVGMVRQINQFFMPMVVHRVLRGNAIAQFAEKLFRAIGLTWAFGSPAILRAVRTD